MGLSWSKSRKNAIIYEAYTVYEEKSVREWINYSTGTYISLIKWLDRVKKGPALQIWSKNFEDYGDDLYIIPKYMLNSVIYDL